MSDPGITIAQLDGSARRLLREQADAETCIAALHAITTDPQVLGRAAGQALGSWRRWEAGSSDGHDGDRVARMLTAAGADPQLRDRVADQTAHRLEGEARRPGIGMPTTAQRADVVRTEP